MIGRDHLDGRSVASPNRETEAMRDGSDVSDWPLLNCASGACWASPHGCPEMVNDLATTDRCQTRAFSSR